MRVSLLLMLAGLMGAAGVVLAAAAAHAKPGAGLDSAAHMLLFHAVAVIAAVALLEAGRLGRTGALIAVGGWILGGMLFSGDIALRAFTSHRLFPLAAPTGGSLLIIAWLLFAIAAASAR
ncbi:MAG: DUF423 domain-containing protein [Hyphomicrobiaceae bacterium]